MTIDNYFDKMKRARKKIAFLNENRFLILNFIVVSTVKTWKVCGLHSVLNVKRLMMIAVIGAFWHFHSCEFFSVCVRTLLAFLKLVNNALQKIYSKKKNPLGRYVDEKILTSVNFYDSS